MPFLPGLSVRILTHEGARAGHSSVVAALTRLVQREGLAGITITRAIEGFGSHGSIRSLYHVDAADELPLLIEIVDQRERLERLLPEIAQMVTGGALTVEAVRLFIAQEEHRISPTPPSLS